MIIQANLLIFYSEEVPEEEKHILDVSGILLIATSIPGPDGLLEGKSSRDSGNQHSSHSGKYADIIIYPNQITGLMVRITSLNLRMVQGLTSWISDIFPQILYMKDMDQSNIPVDGSRKVVKFILMRLILLKQG